MPRFYIVSLCVCVCMLCSSSPFAATFTIISVYAALIMCDLRLYFLKLNTYLTNGGSNSIKYTFN